MKEKTSVLAVVGPTASGKTALAVELAEKLDGEVVSADSMQIYRGMDIATAKPTDEEKKGIPHHLLDFLEPSESFSVADYVTMAGEVIRDIHRRGKLPILAGGTGLYVSSLLEHVRFPEWKADPALRESLQSQAETPEGLQALWQELQQVDPETAAKLHLNNQKRILRAVEVYRVTGQTMSRQIAQSKQRPSPYHAVLLGLDFRDRALLYQRINRRVDKMMEDGLLEEAREFLSQQRGKTAAQAIGYKELQPYFAGNIPLEQALENLKQATRRYAKRQLTWFRRIPDVRWIYLDEGKSEIEVTL